jgi:tetratricopeptide (TPR) repeat protein
MVDKTSFSIETKLAPFFDCLEFGDFKQAKFLLKKICKKHPRHYLGSYAQGLYAAFKEEYVESIPHFQQAITLNPNYALAYYNLAVNYQKIARIDLAVKNHLLAVKHATNEELATIQTSVDITKSIPSGMTIDEYIENADIFATAFSLLETGEYDRSLSLFQSIIANQPEHVQAHGNAGIALMMKGDYELSRRYLESAVKLDPDYEPAIGNLKILADIEKGVIQKPPKIETRDFYAEKPSAKPMS